jgi:quercetin dioxygenase-like cupin family protein
LHERESLGDRIRKARETHNITIKELSTRTGIDTDILKSIEANKMTPPLGELVKLGKALATRMSYFISPGVDKPVTVVRADQRRPVSRNIKTGSEKYGYFYESLAPEKANRRMEPFVVTLVPCDVVETSTHDGQEFLFVLEGQMVARIGGRTESLGPGDALYYDSSEPHYVRCAGGSNAKILAVIYPGSE